MSPPPLDSPPPAARPPIVLGVLGGIASGKSTVARLLAGPRGRVVSADALAHEALEDPEVRDLVREAFGEEALTPAGAVDRAAVARIVFDRPDLRRRLEAWIHPRVRAKISAALEEAASQGLERVVLDVPLLLENDAQHGLVRRCDHLIFVDAPDDVRDRRAVQNRGWAPGEVARRESHQLPLSEKRRIAHAVVWSGGSLQELDESVQRCLSRLGLDP